MAWPVPVSVSLPADQSAAPIDIAADFAGCIGRRRRLAVMLVFLRQAWVEHATEMDVVAVPAAAENDGLARANVEEAMLRLEPAVHRLDGDAEHAAGEWLLAMDGSQRMRQQEFDALVAGAEFERPHDTGAVPALIER